MVNIFGTCMGRSFSWSLPSIHTAAAICVPPLFEMLHKFRLYRQTVITAAVPSANISVLSINMKDGAINGKLIEDSML